MASQDSLVNLELVELQQLCGEQEALLASLLEQLEAAEDERDRAVQGFEMLTTALRRRGCCEGHTNGGTL